VETSGRAGDRETTPRAAAAAVAFFAVAGLLDLAFALGEAPRPLTFAAAWDGAGRLVFHLLLAAGLFRRLAVVRVVALVYCLAGLATYAVVLLLALGQAPLSFPRSVVVGSLYQVPSCALLLPWLRSAEAALWFDRPLFGP